MKGSVWVAPVTLPWRPEQIHCTEHGLGFLLSGWKQSESWPPPVQVREKPKCKEVILIVTTALKKL